MIRPHKLDRTDKEEVFEVMVVVVAVVVVAEEEEEEEEVKLSRSSIRISARSPLRGLGLGSGLGDEVDNDDVRRKGGQAMLP